MTKTTGGGAPRQSPISDSRADRVLAAMIVGIIIISVVAIIVYMIGTAGGWLVQTVDGQRMVSAAGTSIFAIFFVGLPIAIVLMVVVTIRIGIRRRRESEQKR